MNRGRLLAAIFPISYAGVRLIWELNIYKISASPLYGLLNIFLLLPFLMVLSYTIAVGPENRRLAWILFGSAIAYLAAYVALGIFQYPLLFTLRIDNPKSLFIDVFTLCVVVSTILCTFWTIRSNQYL